MINENLKLLFVDILSQSRNIESFGLGKVGEGFHELLVPRSTLPGRPALHKL